jgi:hypothetical protein
MLLSFFAQRQYIDDSSNGKTDINPIRIGLSFLVS